MIKQIAIATMALSSFVAAAETTITGNVQSKCVIYTAMDGVYGNPTADTLTTDRQQGGVLPIVRFDVVNGGDYAARITYPTSFSTSPSLSDTVAWTGNVQVSQVSDPGMSAYETQKVQYESTTVFPLTIAGSVWFQVESTAKYGVGKSFPGGTYRSVVEAECVAK